MENPRKGDSKNVTFASFSRQNKTPTKPTILQIVKVGNIIKKDVFGEYQISCNYENQKKKSYARKSQSSTIAKEVKNVKTGTFLANQTSLKATEKYPQ